MYEVGIKTHFSAAHHLNGYDGCCANAHGHNWDVEVFIRGTELNELGMLVDFKIVKQAVAKVLDDMDHADLNELPAFSEQNPTSENIAKHLFTELVNRFEGESFAVSRITAYETPGNGVSYWE